MGNKLVNAVLFQLVWIACVGGVAGPFSRWVGASTWRAADFTASTFGVLGALMIGWAVATPALVLMADRFSIRGDGEQFKRVLLDKGRPIPPTI